MINELLSIAADPETTYSYNWIIVAATLPPVLLLLSKKKRMSLLQKHFSKKGKLNWLQRWYLKRMQNRMKKGKDVEVGKLFGVLAVLFFLGGAIIAFIKGNAATGVVALLIGLALLGALAK